jgi:hypothetical protein
LTAVNRLQPYRRFKNINLPYAKLERCPPSFNLTPALLLRGSWNTPPLQLPMTKTEELQVLKNCTMSGRSKFPIQQRHIPKNSPADLPFFACESSARNLSYGARHQLNFDARQPGQEVVLISANLTRLAAINPQYLKTSLTFHRLSFAQSKSQEHESKHGNYRG